MRVVPLLAILLLAGCGDTDTPIVADDGRYTITFPGPTTTREEATPSAGGSMTLHVTEWKHPDIDRLHAFMFTDHTVKKAVIDAKQDLDDAVAQLEGVLKSKVREATPVTFGAFKLPGREVRMQHNTRSLWSRALVVFDTRHQRLYTVLVEGGREYVGGPEADAFIESFAIAK
jgi:hypothetical protein